MTQGIRVLIVDRQPRAQQSLRARLATLPEVEEIQAARNGCAAFERVEEFQPDVVLIDLQKPDLDGLDATRLIKQRAPHVKVIILSMYADLETAALAAGADTFVSQGEPPEKLLETFSRVAGL